MTDRLSWLAVLLRLSLVCSLLAGCAGSAPPPTAPTETPTALPWTASIGALALHDDSRICTAVLLRRDLIITASHCLYTWERSIAPSEWEFRPNWGAAPFFAPIPVLALQAQGGSILEGRIAATDVLQDWVLLRIAPAPADLRPVSVSHLTPAQIDTRLAAGDHFYSAGYGGGAKDRLRQHPDCRLLTPAAAAVPLLPGILVSDCVIRLSDSGGPMALVDAAGKPQLIAIISGFEQRAGKPPVGLGVGAGNFVATVDGLTISQK